MVSAATLSQIEPLGKIIYQDKDFSLNKTQSCQTCHHHLTGFADPTNSRDPYYTVVSLGDDGVSVRGRNAPTAAYAGYSPILQQNETGAYFGGMFWDGRATGWTLGDPLTEQAQGPPLNPIEMNMPNKEAVVQAVRESSYTHLVSLVFGEGSLDVVNPAYDNIALTAPYGHNGYFPTLKDMVSFKNSRDVDGWDVPEVTENVNTDNNMGNLGLTDPEINDIVSFLMALTDL